MDDMERSEKFRRPRHDHLDADERNQVEIGKISLGGLLRKEKGWDFIAKDVIKN